MPVLYKGMPVLEMPVLVERETQLPVLSKSGERDTLKSPLALLGV